MVLSGEMQRAYEEQRQRELAMGIAEECRQALERERDQRDAREASRIAQQNAQATARHAPVSQPLGRNQWRNLLGVPKPPPPHWSHKVKK